MKLMLAGKLEPGLIKLPLLASAKLDGVRAFVGVDGIVYSRNNKAIPNRHVQKLFGKRKYAMLDGELIVGRPNAPDAFRRTQSYVMSSQVDLGTSVMFHVFDYVYPAAGYGWRNTKAFTIAQGNCWMQSVSQHFCKTYDDVLTWERYYVEQGYEGLMLRDPNGMYKHGRSTAHEGGLLKLKRFEDAEARVKGVQEMLHNGNAKGLDGKRTSHKAGKSPLGTLGALVVEDCSTGATFQVGSGFSSEERARLWRVRSTLKGKLITYRYFPSGSKDLPRFPTFLGFRGDL